MREYQGNAISAYESISQLESGRLPTNAGEIALPQDYLSMLGGQWEIGDTITLDVSVALSRDTDAPYSYSHDFVLTGILKANYLGYLSGIITGIAGTGTAEMFYPKSIFCIPLTYAQRINAHFKTR